jgi:hypothetical protein
MIDHTGADLDFVAARAEVLELHEELRKLSQRILLNSHGMRTVVSRAANRAAEPRPESVTFEWSALLAESTRLIDEHDVLSKRLTGAMYGAIYAKASETSP